MKKYLLVLGVSLLTILASGFNAGFIYAEDGFTLSVVSVKPNRPHLVQPGKATTFVINLKNNLIDTQGFTVIISSLWNASLQKADRQTFQPQGAAVKSMQLYLGAQQEENLLVKITAPSGAVNGTKKVAMVRAYVSGGINKSLNLEAVVYDRPKIYLVGIDALGVNYLFLTRNGRRRDASTQVNELLMPNVESFLTSSHTAYSKTVYSLLPSATDMNHTSVLTGSWPGTSGIFYVAKYYAGLNLQKVWDSSSRTWKQEWVPKWVSPDHRFLKHGLNGEKDVLTIFDVAKATGPKDEAGTPLIFNLFISGKTWLNGLYKDDKATIDAIVTTYTINGLQQERNSLMDKSPEELGYSWTPNPPYLNPVRKYNFADPVSDDNPADLDGHDPDSSGRPHSVIDKDLARFEDMPLSFPEDRWINQSALKVIAAEDPDVVHIILAGVDDVQHAYGVADRPEEWIDGVNGTPTPGILWDDFNIYNARANREVILDVIYEADACFGMLIDALKGYGKFDSSIVVMYADHSQITFMEDNKLTEDPENSPNASDGAEINLKYAICGDDCVDFDQNIEALLAACDMAELFVTDKGHNFVRYTVPQRLLSFERVHPLTGRKVNPFIVITREEMETGVDEMIGRFAASGACSDERRAELYSEWYVKYSDLYTCKDSSSNTYPSSVGNTPNNIRWPDLLVFLNPEYRFQFEMTNSKNLGSGQSADIDSFIGGHSSLMTQNVPLAMHGPRFKNVDFSFWANTVPGQAEHITLVDIAPTIYKALGLQMPENVDGRSIDEIIE